MGLGTIEEAVNVKPALTIVDPKRLIRTQAFVFINAQRRLVVQAEAITLGFLGGDTDNALNTGIIARTRVC